jgi:hypothetical protein
MAERATQPDAAALPLPDFLRNLHSTESGLSSEPDRYSQTKDMAPELSRQKKNGDQQKCVSFVPPIKAWLCNRSSTA